MGGVKKLRKLQLGLETTAGTNVAATTIWRGLGAIEDLRETVMVEEDVGYLPGVGRYHTPKQLGALSMEETPATFEQLPYILAAGVENVVAGAADGTGSGKVYNYTFGVTGQQTIKTYSIEGGNNQQVEEMSYCFVESFTLSGEAGGPLNMAAEWKGRQVSTTSFTGALTIPSVEEVNFSKGKFYYDAVGGTVGDTQKSNTLLGCNLEVTTGHKPVWTADGNTYFTFQKDVGSEILCELTLEHDGTATALKSAWRDGTPYLYRLKWEGSALATAGTTYTYKTVIADFAGTVENVSKLDEQDGNDIVTVRIRAHYNSTAAWYSEFYVVNELASLP